VRTRIDQYYIGRVQLGRLGSDRIITSVYDTFNAVDELRFTSTLRISQSTT